MEKLDTCYCAVARKAARLTSRIYDQHLASSGLTIPQFSLMRNIERAGDITAASLADQMAMDRTTLVRALKPLQRDGLVIDRRLSSKGRQLAYSLSDTGAAKVEEAMPLWALAQHEIEERAGRVNIENLRQGMREAIKSLTQPQ